MKVVGLLAMIALFIVGAAQAQDNYVFAELVESVLDSATAQLTEAGTARLTTDKDSVTAKPTTVKAASKVVPAAPKADKKDAKKADKKDAKKADKKDAKKADKKDAKKSTKKDAAKKKATPKAAPVKSAKKIDAPKIKSALSKVVKGAKNMTIAKPGTVSNKTIAKAKAKKAKIEAKINDNAAKLAAAKEKAKKASARVKALQSGVNNAKDTEKEANAAVKKINAEILKEKAKKDKVKKHLDGSSKPCPAEDGDERTECLKAKKMKQVMIAKDAGRNATKAITAHSGAIKEDAIIASERQFEVLRKCEDDPSSSACLTAQKNFAESMQKIKKETEKALTSIKKAVTKSTHSKQIVAKMSAKVEASKLNTPKESTTTD